MHAVGTKPQDILDCIIRYLEDARCVRHNQWSLKLLLQLYLIKLMSRVTVLIINLKQLELMATYNVNIQFEVHQLTQLIQYKLDSLYSNKIEAEHDLDIDINKLYLGLVTLSNI